MQGSVWGSGFAAVVCGAAALRTGNPIWRVRLAIVLSLESIRRWSQSKTSPAESCLILKTLLHAQVGFVASLVSKLSDTVSSEIGKVSRSCAGCLLCT